MISARQGHTRTRCSAGQRQPSRPKADGPLLIKSTPRPPNVGALISFHHLDSSQRRSSTGNCSPLWTTYESVWAQLMLVQHSSAPALSPIDRAPAGPKCKWARPSATLWLFYNGLLLVGKSAVAGAQASSRPSRSTSGSIRGRGEGGGLKKGPRQRQRAR